MTAWAIEALLASAVLIALVLAARVPVRRAFGPTVAYALWALPVLRLLLPPLPAGWLHPVVPPPLVTGGERMALLILPPPALDAGPPMLGLVLVATWCIGAVLFLGWQLVAYVRFTRRVARTGVALGKVGRIALVVSGAVADPLAYGLARPVVAVPRDFRTRYGPRERELALAHEVAHHVRGDMAANWVALAVLALHWFNPLAWVAFRAFRVDQEMANDAHVLAERGADERHAYACAIMKAATGRAPAAACGLHTINDLKGRLRMLSQPISRGRRAAGAAVIAGATLGLLGLTASGSDAAETVRAHVERATGVPLDALDPIAMLQAAPADSGPDAPPAPPGPTGPGSGGRHVHAVRDGQSTHVTVTENGHTREMDGAEAEAWLAANPPLAPPAPPAPPVSSTHPVPPTPPVPPKAHAQARTIVVRPGDRGPTLMVRRASVLPGAPLPPGVTLPRDFGLPADCGSASKVQPPAMVIKGGGGDKTYTVLCTGSRGASTASLELGAYRQALASLRTARRSVATQAATAAFPESERHNALAAIDASLAELQASLAEAQANMAATR